MPLKFYGVNDGLYFDRYDYEDNELLYNDFIDPDKKMSQR